MAEVHARQHILVCLGDAHHAIAEDVGIRVRVVFRGDDLRRGVLRILDERILLDDGEVDVGRAGCLRVTAGFLPGLAGKLLDGRVKRRWGTLMTCSKPSRTFLLFVVSISLMPCSSVGVMNR